MSDLVLSNIICFQTQKQLTTLNNIRVLLISVLIDLHAHNFVQVKTSLCARYMHTNHHVHNLSSPEIPLFKKDDHMLCRNYQPISLLSNLSKIIERLIHARLTLFLNSDSILFEKQFGFSHSHSTTHAQIEITEKIKQACDSGQMLVEYFLSYKRHLTLSTMIYFSENATIMVLEA